MPLCDYVREARSVHYDIGTILLAYIKRIFLPWISTFYLLLCHPAQRSLVPTVTLDQATVVGIPGGVVNSFLGIPFAKPPTGSLRFNLPVPNDPYTGTIQATAFGPSCPQQALQIPLPSILPSAVTQLVDSITDFTFEVVEPASEDCLSLNVFVPASATPSSKLPVVVWIFGGGFETGSSSTYPGGIIVSRSIALGKPIIYVSINYRLSALGFLASQEVKDAKIGNLGLQDQRQAFRWVQKYISQFGGDPSKVTIWGESAGAISVALHMVANGGNNEGLFRAAFMESGSPAPSKDITAGQANYDALVSAVGCNGASDTLACLRTVDFQKLQIAMDNSANLFGSQSLNLAWGPSVDGVFITAAPQKLVQTGTVAKVPFVTGDCDDEGTIFSLSLLNIITDTDFVNYMTSNYFPTANTSVQTQMSTLWPADVTQGSPFNTGLLNAITPQFKRLAAIQGDLAFQAPRRFFLQQRSSVQNTWSFLNKRLKLTPVVGT
ncbi:carotenoid ester lipase precursor, partial [Sistotremastrum niveocremeum HHB9708]